MGPNTIGSTSNAVSGTAVSFTETQNAQAATNAATLKVNYGDAAKADRLAVSLMKTRQMQIQAQAHVAAKNPDFAGER